MNESSGQLLVFYEIVGSRIVSHQDRLASLSIDDPGQKTLIAILVEFDELKKDLNYYLNIPE
jgi:hypothetical protein